MSIHVKLFGSLVEAVGQPELEVKDCKDTTSLKDNLVKEFPRLSNYEFVIAIYKQIVDGNTKINNGDVVALLPPFAGG